MKYKTPYYESKRGKDGLFHFLYKTTNILNNKFYIGVHTTDDLGDGYKGSGSTLNKAFKKYGKNNFNREILEFFETYEDAYNKEREVVSNELINNPDCYNNVIGGKGNPPGFVLSKNTLTNEVIKVSVDEYYNNNQYISINKGTIPVWNKEKNIYERVQKSNYDEKLHEPMHKNKIVVYNTLTKNYEQVNINDPRRENGILVSPSKNKVTVYNENGDCVQIDKNCPEYLSGKYKPISSNRWTLRDKNTGKCISVQKGSDVDWDKYEYVTCRQKKCNNPNLKRGRLIGDKKYKWYNSDDIRFKTLDIFVEKPKGYRNIYYTNKERSIEVVLHKDEIEEFLKYHNDWSPGHKIYKKSIKILE